MAQIGYGYGSEFQLLRFLGYHRNWLNQKIAKLENIQDKIKWLDFDFGNKLKTITCDEEIKGLQFLEKIPFVDANKLEKAISVYRSYNIKKINSWQNWDAIFYSTNTLYLVEAKAYSKEMFGEKKEQGGHSKDDIKRYMSEALRPFHIKINNNWLRESYQFANRLATTAFLQNLDINTKFLYIFFKNGYSRRVVYNEKIYEVFNKDEDSSEDKYKAAFNLELKNLGITYDSIKDLCCNPILFDASTKEATTIL